MKTLEEKIKESTPTLVVILHSNDQKETDVKNISESVKTKYEGKANVVIADDRNGQLKVKYRLEEYPSYILFKEGQELMRESGVKTEEKLSELIDRAL